MKISMLDYYLSSLHGEKYDVLFKGIEIDKCIEIKNRHANKYNTKKRNSGGKKSLKL
jgi:hypothetical protein